MNFFNNIDLNKNELRNALMHPALTAPSDPKPGQMYFNTSDNKLYYYNNNKKWVALNEIDISGKLDKITGDTTYDQAYIKLKAGGDNCQSMVDISDQAIANKATLALRQSDGRLKVADAKNNDDAVTLLQLNNSIKAAVKVKDVTLDGTSIVDTETGVVALESTYSITLIGANGTLEPAEYNNLNGDNTSYIWYKIEEGAAPVRLTKQQVTSSKLSYQTVSGTTITNVTINSASRAWTAITKTIQLTDDKVTTINDKSTDTQYPSAKAVYGYVTDYVATEIGKIDQFEYKVSTNAATTPEGIVWYSGTTEDTKIVGTLKASASTEYTIYLVPCKHTAEETQKGYDEYLTIKNSAGVYVWEILGNTRDLDLSNYVTLDTDQSISGHKTFGAGLTADAIATFNGSAQFNEDLVLACPIVINNNAGTAGQVLTSQGAGQAPQWATIPQGTVKKYVGNITVAAGGTTGPTANVNHNLGVTGCTVSLYQANELVMADIKIVDTNNIQIIFGQPFTTAQTFQVVVTG